MGRAYDTAGSYEGRLITLAISTLVAAALLALMPGYPRLSEMQPRRHEGTKIKK
jgi:hypothetical protein